MITTSVQQTQDPQPNHDGDRCENLDRDVRDLGALMAMDWGLRNMAEADQKRRRGPKR